MNDLAYRAMRFATEAHKDQRRKYTGAPYADHLGEVAGIVATVSGFVYTGEVLVPTRDEVVAVAWLHDCVEDQGVGHMTIQRQFGEMVRWGVVLLSDLEQGNRAERKAASRARLAEAPGWVQTIKCADLISNTKSIVQHDPKFAVTYLAEKRALLEVMTKAHPALRGYAMELAGQELQGQEGESRGE